MKKALLLSLFVLGSFITMAQTADTTKQSNVFTSVEQNAEFPGGVDAFVQYVAKKIRYPIQAFQAKQQGKVFLSFIVERDGSITDISIVRSVSPDIDAEAIRVIKSSPRWKPAIQNGRAVRFQCTLPITFRIPGYARTDSLNKQQSPPTPKADPDAEIKPMDRRGFGEQKDQSRIDTMEVNPGAQQQPEFPGGMFKFVDYIKDNLKYPKEAKQNEVEGQVFVTFIVERDGSLSNVKVVRGIGSGCDEEAVRLLRNSPKWIPAQENGRPVRAAYALPISFKL